MSCVTTSHFVGVHGRQLVRRALAQTPVRADGVVGMSKNSVDRTELLV